MSNILDPCNQVHYTLDQIKAGIELAQHWYEGWKFDDLEPNQILEAINIASTSFSVTVPKDWQPKYVSAVDSGI